MRYLLIIIGFIGAVGGTVAVGQSRGQPDNHMFLGLGFMVGGLVFAGLGMATCDIVNAISGRRP